MLTVSFVRKLTTTLVILMYCIVMLGQGPSWSYTVTSTEHLFFFPDDVVVCSEDTLEIGDYLGLFYDSTGTLACAGYFIWNGGNQNVIAYGDDTLTTIKEGFSLDEEVVWKTFQTSAQLEYFLDAIYAHTPFYPDSGFFVNNGLSELVYLGNCVSPIVSVNTYDAICHGGQTGSAWIEIFPLNPPYTTTWTGGQIGDSIIGLSAGVYFVDVENALGFVSSRSYIIGEPDSIEILFNNSPVTVPGTPDGDVNIIISGGTFPYQFSWNNGASTQNLNNVFAGEYVVDVTDYYNCATSDSTELLTIAPFPWDVIITPEFHQVSLLSISNLFFNEDGIEIGDVIGVFYDSAGVESCAGSIFYAGSFGTIGTTINCYGDNPLTPEIDGFALGEEFKWKVWDASTAIAHEVFPNYLISPEHPDSANFLVGGNSALNALSIIEHDMGISSFIAPNTYCNLTATEDIILDIFSLGMVNETSFNIKYSVNGGPWLNETINQSLSYEDTIQVTLSTPANLLVPINYQLIAVIEATNDLNLSNDTAYLDISPIMTSSATVHDTMNNCVGKATVYVQGGTPPYSYLWDDPMAQTDSLAIGLCVGVYNVAITDSLGCVVSQFANITNILPPTFTIDTSNVSCYGFQDAYIDITMENFQFPLNFFWSNGEITEDLNNIGPGTYIITITDGTNLSTIDTFIVTQPDTLNASAYLEDILCYGQSTGIVDLSVSGGNEPYSFSWSNGDSSEDLLSVVASNYIVTINDANDCVFTDSYTLTQPTNLQTNIDIIDATLAGICDGSISLTNSGATQPYSFEWSDGSTSEDIENICSDYYSVTITDGNACEFIYYSLYVDQPSPNISGEIYIGPNLLTDGIAILYYEYSNNKYIAVEYLVVDSGKYSFTLDPYNSFLIYALPNSKYDFNFYPTYFPTYLGDNLKWEDANKIHTTIDIENDIHLESYDSLFYGSGSISGDVSFIYEADYESNIYGVDWFDTVSLKSDDLFAAKNIPLVLFQPDGTQVAYTLSDIDGSYSFKNVPIGDYIIHAEKAGFKTQYKVVSLTQEEPDYIDLRVLISSGNIFLNISSIIPGLEEISIYPNPAENNIYVNILNGSSINYKISIISSSGRIIKEFHTDKFNIDVSDLQSGLYFIMIENGVNNYSSKFVKMK